MTQTRAHNTLWQDGRWMPALDPDAYRLDDRQLDDLAHWAIGFAELLIYFDNQNVAVPARPGSRAPWASFFQGDVTFLLAEMCVTHPEQDFATVGRKPSGIKAAIQRDINRLAIWSERADELALLAPSDSVEAALSGTLQRTAQNEMAGVLPSANHFDLARNCPAALPQIWFDDQVFYDEPATLFSLLNRVTGQIVNRAKGFLRQSLKKKSDHPAQTGLFLAFLNLLRKNQHDLNGLTERHLDFYYTRVLDLTPRNATPDQAHVAFDLAPEQPGFMLPKGTALVAGSASVPDPVVFVTDHAISINRIRLDSLRALIVSRQIADTDQPPDVLGVRAYPRVNSADGFGAPLPPEVTDWPAFGPAETTLQADAALGFALESAVLAMREGRREITLTLRFAATPTWRFVQGLAQFRARAARLFPGGTLNDDLLRSYVARAFRLQVSGETAPLTLQDVTATLPDDDSDTLILSGVIPAQAEPIQTPKDHIAPLLSVTLNPNAPVYGYDLIGAAQIDSARIDTVVSGMRSLDLAGPFGPIDPTKPFAPFGQLPLPGDAFNITSPELTQSAMHQFDLTLDWTDLPVPPDSFARHYEGYDIGLSAQSFRVRLSRSDGQAWHPMPALGSSDPVAGSDLALFDVAAPPEEHVLAQSRYAVHRVAPTPQTPLATIGAPQRPGALRIELTNPPQGFGQTMYPGLVARVAIANAQGKKARKLLPAALQTGGVLEPPKPPLLPLVDGVSASYRARAASNALTRADQPIRLLQYNPLGVLTPSRDGLAISGDYDFDGMLMLGLTQADPPETLSLLFDMSDLVARPWVAGDGFVRPSLHWRYFDGKIWRDLDGDAIQMDQTQGLMTRGILRIALPGDLAPGARYPGGLCWLAICVTGDVRRYGRIRQILPQAVAATRVLNPDDTHTERPQQPAGAITRLANPHAAIRAVLQPYATQGGRAREDTRSFRERVSERLSHKHRAILPRDVTRMVLERFPGIAQVSCLTLRPGRIEVIVTPRRTVVDPETLSQSSPPLVPLHTRLEISAFLDRYSNDNTARAMVRNPEFEILRVRAELLPGPDATSAVLHEVACEIQRLTAPWLFDPTLPMPIGQARLDPSTLRASVEQIPEVARIQALSVQQVYRLQGGRAGALFGFKDTARTIHLNGARPVLKGSSPWSVFMPHFNHAITFAGPRHGIGQLRVGQDLYVPSTAMRDTYLNDPDLIPTLPQPVGIGSLVIGADFISTDSDDVIAPFDPAISAYPVPDQPLLPLSELD